MDSFGEVVNKLFIVETLIVKLSILNFQRGPDYTSDLRTIETLCAIWYHLCNVKNVETSHGGVLLLVKVQVSASLQASASVALPYGCFSRFLNFKKCFLNFKKRLNYLIRTSRYL